MSGSDKKYKEVYDKFHPKLIRDIKKEDYAKFKKYQLFGGEDTVLMMGDWFLFEIEENSYKDGKKHRILNYPVLAIFSKYIPCDQTLEVEYIEYQKSWHQRLYFQDDKKFGHLIYQPIQTKYHIDWDDSMWVYGKWKSKPDYKELKKAFRKTQWYHRDKHELRDIRLQELLGQEK